MLFLLFSLLVAPVYANNVLEFTDADFDVKIKQHDLILMEFFAPWCGHCKKLEPEYEKAATILKSNDVPASLGKVDCIANSATCQKYDVSGYPTLKIFRNGVVSEDYNGPREADGIAKLMRKKAGPASKEIVTISELENFLKNPEISVIGFFPEESDLAKRFQEAANSLSEDFRFAHTTSQEIFGKYGYNDAIVLYQPPRLHNKFESSEVKYEGSDSLQEVKMWINNNAHGLCGHRTSGNQGQFSHPLVIAYYDVDYFKNPKGTNYWRNRILKVAKDYSSGVDALTFAISNHKDFSHEVEEFGAASIIAGAAGKPIICLKASNGNKYRMEKDFSMDNLREFLKDFASNKLVPYLKSEPLPDNAGQALKTVVAKNFDEIVNDPTKDVLIEFYAPWCGHCKSLAPKYEELANKLNEPNVVIAKMDATANDVPPPFEVRGFPTLFFVPSGDKQNPRKYEGGREINDFIKYLAREATNELKGYDRNGKNKKSEL